MKEKSFKRWLSLALAVLMIITAVPFAGGTFEARAEDGEFTEGYYTCTVENGEATITDCDESISGDVVIPDTLDGYLVTSIGYAAFENCTGLTSITIPDSVINIGDGAFYDCTELTNITIPDSVTSIGYSTFRYCQKLTGVKIGNSLTSISDWTFYGCTGLTSITIPDNVTSIGNDAFYNCTGLKSVTIGNGVTSIGEDAFSWCTGITNVTIGNSVTSIGEYAFYHCTRLKSVTIGNIVASIGNSAFSDCPSLTNVTIPNSVTSIGSAAFSGCAGLTSIAIPDSVVSIGEHAFSNCAGLTSITIPDSVTSIDYCVFCGCAGLTSITIPDSVTSIGKDAFRGCTGLASITIPDSVTSIGSWAFEDCTGLTSVTIGNSVTSIGEDAFRGCTGLTKINWNAESVGNFDYKNFIFSNAGTAGEGIDVVFGDNVKSIPAYAFIIVSNIKSVAIGNSVTSIGDATFCGCTGLTSITIPDSVVSIGEHAFSNCAGLTNVTISNSVTSIGDNVFSGCTGITSIAIPDSITSIGERVFSYCTGLTNITIPNSVTSIDTQAFEGCTALTSITIPDSVTSIGRYAFQNCYGLTSITIPSSVTDIGDYALGYYSNWEDEYIKLDNFTIYGYPGTAAETYANKNGFTFISLDEEHTHSFSAWTVTTEATCTAEGVETRTCSGCGATETRKTEKKEHSLTHVEKDSTCKIQGVSYDMCDMCENTFNYTVLPLAPHTFGDWATTKEAKCEVAGEEKRSCSVCGATETREIAALEHDYKHITTASTCTKHGFEKDVCNKCGNEINYKKLPLAPHTFGEWKVTKEATYFEYGEKVRICSVCGFEETEKIEKLPVSEVTDESTGISIIYPDNAYSSDIQLNVSVVTSGSAFNVLNAEKDNFKKSLFDITTTINGEKVQPNGTVLVKIPLPEGFNPEKTVVYHVSDDGKLEKMESKVENGYIIFETTHFSYYAIVDESPTVNPSQNCSCICHKGGISAFFYKIARFFWKLFKVKRTCACNAAHY